MSSSIPHKIIEFCSTKTPGWCSPRIGSDKASVKKALQDEIGELAKPIIQKVRPTIKSFKPGYIYEVVCLEMLGEKAKAGDRKRFGKYIPDIVLSESVGPLKKGVVEIRGFCHWESGTADEKNYYMPEKYEGLLNEDEWVSVIFCGKVDTRHNTILLQRTESYLQYLKSPEMEGLSPHDRLRFELWKLQKFNGFYRFDELLELSKPVEGEAVGDKPVPPVVAEADPLSDALSTLSI